jgi:hypothetical protein
LKKRINPTPYSPITHFKKEYNPSIHQTHLSFPMKLLKALNNLYNFDPKHAYNLCVLAHYDLAIYIKKNHLRAKEEL